MAAELEALLIVSAAATVVILGATAMARLLGRGLAGLATRDPMAGTRDIRTW